MTKEAEGQSTRVAKALFFCAIGLVVLAALFIVNHSTRWLLGMVPDDAFYYLEIAKRYSATGISTFDGINPTNGYHPAWMFQLAALAKVASDRDLFLKVAILLGFVWHIATGFLIVALLRRWLDEFLAWIGGACWLLSANFLFLAVMSVEASFYIFTLALCLLVYFRKVHGPLTGSDTGPTVLGWFALGLTLGLMLLARTEGVVILVLVVITLTTLVSKNKAAGKHFPIIFMKAVFVTAAGCLLVAAPWILFSKAQVGSVTQDSGTMKALWAGLEHSQTGLPHRIAGVVAGVAKVSFVWPIYNASARQPLGLVLAAAAFITFVYLALKSAGQLRNVAAWLIGSSVLLSGFYFLRSSDIQPWYSALPSVALFLAYYGLTAKWSERTPETMRRFGFGALALTTIGFAFYLVLTPRVYWDQVYLLDSQRQFEQELPAGSKVGSMNAGIPAYFSDRVTVVNIDGLVNHNVVPYWQNHKFDQYFKDAGIQYIAEVQDWLDNRSSHFSSGPLKLQKLDEHPGNHRSLWRIEP